MKQSFLYIIMALFCIFAEVDKAFAAKNTKTISGKVIGSNNRKGLANVNISLKGTNIGTVSNNEGHFSFFIPDDRNTELEFSALGYSSLSISVDSLFLNNYLISLDRTPIELDEITVYSGDPVKIISSAIRKIPENYSLNNDLLSMFYRETIRKGKRFIGVSEAAINVYKTPYKKRNVDYDRVQIDRGRRLVSQKSSDTLAVKILGGPNLAVNIDIVKNADILFTEHELNDFDFRMEKPQYFDDRAQYVISFKPRVKRDYAQFKGKIYIDIEKLCFTRAEFEMLPEEKDKMTAAILHKKPRGLSFSPQKIGFVVSYKFTDGKTYLNYICNEMRFKCDMKRRLFSSSYTAYAEMVVVDREENPAGKIAFKESFKPRQIFYDLVNEYWDEDYWNNYNIIAPSESLENAIDKLKKTGTVLSMQ